MSAVAPLVDAAATAPALRFVDVKKRFGARAALAGLTLEVPRGSFFGLIGPNGAGKTTAFSLACGFLQHDAGEIEILGLRGYAPAQLKGRVLAMPQDAALGRETRCLEHLTYFGRLQGLSAAEARREGERVLEEVGLADRRDARTKTLSHGMLRRLSIAQALLARPELVLLDEPTSGLDPRHAHELRELLRRTRVDGRTIVVSSHNLHELEELCDHVAFIDRGVVLAAGPTDVMTGRGQEIEIELGAGPTPTAAVAAALTDAFAEGPAPQVAWDDARRQLSIRFRPSPERQPEDVIGVALKTLLAAGARVAGVRRGTSLERKFFEIT
jgi:ABC-2 type transport system ATP-binding protein